MKYLVWICLILVACNSTENSPDAKLVDGFYLKSETSGGIRIQMDKCSGENCHELLQAEPLMVSQNLNFNFKYQQPLYADTFGIIQVAPKKEKATEWKSALKKSKGKEAYFIHNNKIISWTTLYDTTELDLCYCDYSEKEIKELEKFIK